MKINIECSETELSCIINNLICSKPKTDNIGAADTAPTHGVSEKDRELLRKELECLSNESLFMGGNKDVLADYALAMCELYRTLNPNYSANNQTPTSQSQIPTKSILSDNPYLYEAVQQLIHRTENEKNSQLPKTVTIDDGDEFSTTD